MHNHDAPLDVFCIHSVRWAGAGASGWSGVREKYYWLAGGWKLVLERCERKILLGWRLLELPNIVSEVKMGIAYRAVNTHTE